MLGPFALRYVHLFVEEQAGGAFILSRNGRTADFVGMSETMLADSLNGHKSKSGYRFFWFSYAKTPHEAQEMAQYWFHRYRPTDNLKPPDQVSGFEWHCTEEGCTACALPQPQK